MHPFINRVSTVALLMGLVMGASANAAPTSFTAQPGEITDYHPIEFLDTRIEQLKEFVAQRPQQTFDKSHSDKITIQTRAVRNEFLKRLYKIDLVRASDLTKMLSDKLIAASLFYEFLGEAAPYYHPKTMGLKYFLAKHKLVDGNGNLIASRQLINKKMQEEFPNGNIVKPAAGMNSYGKSKGFYFNTEEFLDDLLAENSELYSPQQFKKPFFSEMLKTVSSGEFLILQENIITAAGIDKPVKAKGFAEVRVHSLENKVVEDATFVRWRELDLPDEKLKKASAFVQDFLTALPIEFTSRQAWSFDVAALDNGVYRIIEINTNRGRKHHWSGFLSLPGALGAYTRHIEKHYPIKFSGFNGFLLRQDLGNITKYIKKKYFEGSLE